MLATEDVVLAESVALCRSLGSSIETKLSGRRGDIRLKTSVRLKTRRDKVDEGYLIGTRQRKDI